MCQAGKPALVGGASQLSQSGMSGLARGQVDHLGEGKPETTRGSGDDSPKRLLFVH